MSSGSLGNKMVTVVLCRDCSARKEKDTVRDGEKKARYHLQRANEMIKAWGKCQADLAPGLRYWVCKDAVCEHECKSGLHTAWAAEQVDAA